MDAAQPLNSSIPLDLTEARRLARGERQGAWLEALLDSEAGLRPGDGAKGRWASGVYRRIEAFMWDLRVAGYVIEKRPFGPRRIYRFALTGQSTRYGRAARLHRAGLHDALDDLGRMHPALAALSETHLETLEGLELGRSIAVADAVAIVKRRIP